MIKFFRQLRYKSMNQNKSGKYFKYAIGEIILVVIGILIALFSLALLSGAYPAWRAGRIPPVESLKAL